MTWGQQTEWRVSWFPPDKGDQHVVYKREGAAKAMFEAAAAEDYAPILERRTVEVGPWETVMNALDEPPEASDG